MKLFNYFVINLGFSKPNHYDRTFRFYLHTCLSFLKKIEELSKTTSMSLEIDIETILITYHYK